MLELITPMGIAIGANSQSLEVTDDLLAQVKQHHNLQQCAQLLSTSEQWLSLQDGNLHKVKDLIAKFKQIDALSSYSHSDAQSYKLS